MFLNEGFVIMRHVHPWFAAKRESLIVYLGRYWKVTHSIADTLWIVLIAYGYYLLLCMLLCVCCISQITCICNNSLESLAVWQLEIPLYGITVCR